MVRTLLPVFSEFKLANGVNKKEELETFGWMNDSDRGDYEKAKAAIDNLEGSREWLKSYSFDENSETMPFCNGLGVSLLGNFGDHHSGSSATRLAWNYKSALNDWNLFVYKVKESYLLAQYKSQQLTKDDIPQYISLVEFKETFNIPYDDDTTISMVSDLKSEIIANEWASIDKAKAERLAGKIGVLKHHYAFPDRWFDGPGGSSLFGSPEDIRDDLLCEMTKIYSDYPEHLNHVLEAFKVHILWYNTRKDVTRAEAAELEAWASMAKSRLFDPPNLTEGEKHTRASLDRISKSRASYLTRVPW
jgi:hypothetical protein